MGYVGSAAGGTLGFIMGDIPGAYIGSKLGNYLSKNKQTMAPTKRPRANQETIGKATKKSKGKGKMYGPRSKVTNVGRSVVGQSARQAVHKRVKDGIKEKRKKKVKVPKMLKKQILQVFDKKDIYGTMKLVCHGTVLDMNTDRYIDQKVLALPLPRIADNKQAGLLFDPYFWQFVAARLFNGRPPEVPIANTWGNLRTEYGTYGDENTPWTNFNFLASGNAGMKMTVQKAKAKITMKNNSTRTMYLNLYVCAPKYQRASGTMTEPQGHAVYDWDRALHYEGSFTRNPGAPFGGQTVASTTNLNNFVKTYTMYSKPTDIASWNRLWKADTYKITLEPGQVHTHYVQGDEIDIDFAKMYIKSQSSSSAIFADLQKFCRCVFITGTTELAYDTAVGGIRAQNNVDGPDGGTQRQYLLVETEIDVKIKMPEITGGSVQIPSITIPAGNEQHIIPATAEIFNNTNRKRVYTIEQFTNAQSLSNSGFEMNVDDNTTGKQLN